MLRNTQIALLESLETRTLFSASAVGVAEVHEQFNVQHAALNVSHRSSTKAARQAARQALIAEKKAAAAAAKAAKAAKQAARKAAKNHTVTPVAPTAPTAPATPTTPAAPVVPVALPEPGLTNSAYHYQAFSTEPLFAAGGPSENDITQGDIGDCYFLSTLSATAKTDPGLIHNSVSELSNGDFQVEFHSNGQTVDEVVDNQLPVDSAGHLVYAQLGQGDSLWVAILEKAFCAFYSKANTYNGISGGWMDSVFAALGANPSDTFSATNGAALLASIQSELNAGDAVTIGINQPEDGAVLVGDHAYTVDSIGTDSNGNLTLTVRNPWGIAGAGANPFGSAYVTLTAQQAIDSMIGVVAAHV